MFKVQKLLPLEWGLSRCCDYNDTQQNHFAQGRGGWKVSGWCDGHEVGVERLKSSTPIIVNTLNVSIEKALKLGLKFDKYECDI